MIFICRENVSLEDLPYQEKACQEDEAESPHPPVDQVRDYLWEIYAKYFLDNNKYFSWSGCVLVTPSATTPRGDIGDAPSLDCKQSPCHHVLVLYFPLCHFMCSSCWYLILLFYKWISVILSSKAKCPLSDNKFDSRTK